MTSKTTLSLIELLIMVLVFAIAAAVCLNIFVYSNNLSRQSDLTDRAVITAKNAAEILKNTHGDIDCALNSCDETDLSLDIDLIDCDNIYLGKANISVSSGNSVVYTLDVCWQEEVA